MKILSTDSIMTVPYEELAELLGVSPSARIYMIEADADDNSNVIEGHILVYTTTEEDE